LKARLAILSPGRIKAKPALLNIEMINRELAEFIDAQTGEYGRFIEQAARGETV